VALNRLVVIAGPTGTGKSDLAVAVAERLDGEVVNADSMQLYRGMDICTANLPVPARRGGPPHLLDILEVTQTASVAAYQRDARAAAQDVLDRGRTPLLVGGSGLYLQAVVDDLAFPGTDPAVRARWEEELAERGVDALHQQLARLDPAAAAAIQPRNSRRIVRALEVIEITGRPFAGTLPRPGAPRYDAALVCLDTDPAELDRRLADRVHAMMLAGFLDGVRTREGRGLRDGLTASRALGYRQLLAVLDGTATLESAVADTVTATRRFVRRQRSWFARDPRLIRMQAADPDLVSAVLRVARATG
jgi:tRNA dimethylallyltransferase